MDLPYAIQQKFHWGNTFLQQNFIFLSSNIATSTKEINFGGIGYLPRLHPDTTF